MGEIADSMIGGEMCEACGVWLDCMINDEKDKCSEMQIPMYCSSECAKNRGSSDAQVCPH